MAISTTELKQRIIEALNLQDLTAEQIDDDAPLFGTGLGLDSIDALELSVAIEKHFGVSIPNAEAAREAFQNLETLAAFIEKNRKNK